MKEELEGLLVACESEALDHSNSRCDFFQLFQIKGALVRQKSQRQKELNQYSQGVCNFVAVNLSESRHCSY